MLHNVEITETLQRVIPIEADNEYDAINKVRQLYKNEKIVLDSSDYIDTEINIFL